MQIQSVAASFPERVVTNDEVLAEVQACSEPHTSEKELEKILGKIQTLFEISGTERRRWRAEGERSFDIAKKAITEALDQASLKPSDIDLLLYVGVGRGWLEPGMANLFQYELGMKNATCFDILDACLSWLRALHISYNFLKNGVYKNIMIMNAEFNREYREFAIKSVNEIEYKFAQLTIGEASTATIISNGNGNRPGIEPFFEFKTDSDSHTLCKIPLPHIHQYSNDEKCPSLDALKFFAFSKELFSKALELIPKYYYSSPELQKREVDIGFGHAASKPILDIISKELGHDGKTVNIYSEYGNTVSATVPTAMNWAIENGKLKRGMKMLIGMGSAGFSVGFGHMEY